MKKLFNKIKQNHWLMMIICCAIPLVLLVILIYFFDLKNKYLFWFILFLCPIIHYFMMRDMHKKHISKEDKEMEENNKNGENKKCH